MMQLSHQYQFKAFGGECDIDIVGVGNHDHLIKLAVDEVRRIETKFSRYIASSIVGKINANAGLDWVSCDDETQALFEYANTLYNHSDGLFDITSGVLRSIWDFKKRNTPSLDELEQILPLIGWTNFERQDHAVRLKNVGMQIDLGGFGKEYAVDRVATLFLESGVTSALINFGGDVRALGAKPDGRPWQIGIQNPRQLEQCFATLSLSQGALATSGDYERFFELDGKRYCHILNPKTGIPVSYWRSVTVLAPLTSAAGATSTIAMLLQEQGLEYLQNSDFAFLAMDHMGNVFQSD